MKRNNTFFKIKVHEHFSKKTKKGAASTGVFIILASVVAGIAGTLGWKEFGYWLFGLCMLLSPILAIVGVLYIVVNLFRPTREVICASCKHKNTVFRNSRSYVCSACNQLLILGEDAEQQPMFSPCPYCGLKTAVSEDAGTYLCSDCGITLHQKTQVIDKQEKCPSCGLFIPSEAIYCATCGEIMRLDIQNLEKVTEEELKYGIEWTAGKSALGHYYYSKEIILLINDLLERGSLKGLIRSPFDLLNEMLLSIEQASLDSEIYQKCGSLLPDLDRVYGKLLGWELSVFNSVFSKSDNFDSYPLIPKKEKYIDARRRIEVIYGDDLKEFGSIGVWTKKLVAWKEDKNLYGQPTGRFSVEKNGYEPLKQEKSRFDKWSTKHANISTHNKTNSAEAKSRAAD